MVMEDSRNVSYFVHTCCLVAILVCVGFLNIVRKQLLFVCCKVPVPDPAAETKVKQLEEQNDKLHKEISNLQMKLDESVVEVTALKECVSELESKVSR